MLRTLVLAPGAVAITLQSGNGERGTQSCDEKNMVLNAKGTFLECGPAAAEKKEEEPAAAPAAGGAASGGASADGEDDKTYKIMSDNGSPQEMTSAQVAQYRQAMMTQTAASADKTASQLARQQDGTLWAMCSMIPIKDAISRAITGTAKSSTDDTLGNVYSNEVNDAKKIYFLGLEMMKNQAKYTMTVDASSGWETYSSGSGADLVELKYKYHSGAQVMEVDLQANGKSVKSFKVAPRAGNINGTGYDGSKKGFEMTEQAGPGIDKDFLDKLPTGDSLKSTWVGSA